MNSRRTTRASATIRAPSKVLLMLESRAMADALGMMPMFALKGLLPSGDGHPVLVLPGFLASSRSTYFLRRFLIRLGYAGHRWKLGRNLGYRPDLYDRIGARLLELADRYQSKVSLIGWSLGGVYARELAREWPHAVRSVISMGSPFRHPQSTNVRTIYEFFSGRIEDYGEQLLERLAQPPPVPTTALYTRGDGVVAWQSTVEHSERHDVENIHVGGAHMGLGFNPRALLAIADRLAQPEHDWQRFRPRGLMNLLYANWYPDWLVGAPEPEWSG